MNEIIHTLVLGIGATAIMDVWGFLRRPLLGMASPDYALVGRWVGHMASGQFQHAAIGKAQTVKGERLLGWIFHYLTGIAFAGVLVAWAGSAWLQRPTPAPALLVGIGSLVAPFLLMQPAMGAGLAARRTPRPNQARLQSLITHTVFGLGLYVTALALSE